MEAVTVTGETAWVRWVGKTKKRRVQTKSPPDVEPLERKINEREIDSRLEVTGNG